MPTYELTLYLCLSTIGELCTIPISVKLHYCTRTPDNCTAPSHCILKPDTCTAPNHCILILHTCTAHSHCILTPQTCTAHSHCILTPLTCTAQSPYTYTSHLYCPNTYTSHLTAHSHCIILTPDQHSDRPVLGSAFHLTAVQPRVTAADRPDVVN